MTTFFINTTIHLRCTFASRVAAYFTVTFHSTCCHVIINKHFLLSSEQVRNSVNESRFFFLNIVLFFYYSSVQEDFHSAQSARTEEYERDGSATSSGVSHKAAVAKQHECYLFIFSLLKRCCATSPMHRPSFEEVLDIFMFFMQYNEEAVFTSMSY